MGFIGSPILAAVSDGAGRRLSPLSFPITAAGEPADITGTDDGFAVFSLDGSLTEVDLDGRVRQTRSIAASAVQKLRAGWNGSRFLVASPRSSGSGNVLEARLLDHDGNLVEGPLSIQDNVAGFTVVATGNGFALAVSGATGLYAYRVTNDGEMTSRLVDLRANSVSGPPVATVTATGDLFLVWSSYLGSYRVLNTARVTPAGELSAGGVLTTFEGPRTLQPLAVVPSGEAFLVAYRNAEAIETLIVGSGNPVTLADDVLDATASAEGDTIFVAYTPSTIYPLRVLGVAVRADGRAGQHELVSYSRTRQTQPALVGGGGRYLAAWTDIAGAAAFVRAASVGLDAQPVTDRIIAPAYFAAHDLAWNGTESLAVGVRDSRLLASRLTYDGTSIDAEPLVIDAGQASVPAPPLIGIADPDATAAVAWAGDRWMIVWPSGTGLRAATVSRAGEVSAPRDVALTSPLHANHYRAGLAAALAANDTTILLSWREEQRPECFFPSCPEGVSRTFAARLSKDGQLLDAAPLELPPAAAVSVATSGREFGVLGDTTVSAIDASATPRLIASRRLLDWEAKGDVTWDGTSYAVALRYHSYRGLRWHLSVTHVDRNATPIGGPVGTETLAPDVFVAPSIASILPSSALVAVQEGDAKDGARAVVYAERTMTPLPPPPSPPRHVRVTPVTGGLFEVEWEPSLEGEVELYFVEGLTYGGAWTVVGTVLPTQPLRTRSVFETVRVRAFNAGGPSEAASNRARRRRARP